MSRDWGRSYTPETATKSEAVGWTAEEFAKCPDLAGRLHRYILDLRDLADALQAERDRLLQGLWTCAREAGEDLSAYGPDTETIPAGVSTDSLLRAAVDGVRDLSHDSDEAVKRGEESQYELCTQRDSLLSLVQRLLDHGPGGSEWQHWKAGETGLSPDWLGACREARARVAEIECSERPTSLYLVEVIGGGRFVYDLIDVGRFAQGMATEGDARSFSIVRAKASDLAKGEEGGERDVLRSSYVGTLKELEAAMDQRDDYRKGWMARGRELNDIYDALTSVVGFSPTRDPVADIVALGDQRDELAEMLRLVLDPDPVTLERDRDVARALFARVDSKKEER